MTPARKSAAPGRSRRPASVPVPVQADEAGSVTIAMAFAEVGHAVRTMLPHKASAKERAALEYYGASVANQLAEAWRTKAKRQAVVLGVLPDYEAHPLPVGTAETVYAGGVVTIALKVTPQAARVDVVAFVADLEKSGVKPAVLKRLLKKHTRLFAGAHNFTATLV